MTRPIGRPPGPHGPYAATVNGRNTAARVYAIVGQIVDELERRRANGKDLVKRACDEIEKMPALDALRALRELLPKDADTAGKVPTVNMAALFVNAAREIGQRDRELRDANTPMASLIELTANVMPVPDAASAEPERDARTPDGSIEW